MCVQTSLDSRRGKWTAAVVGVLTCFMLTGLAYSKQKKEQNGNDLTGQLYNYLDSNQNGKLQDFYLMADSFPDPKNPGKELQHVLKVDYDRSRFFGRFRIYVRTVGKPDAVQLKAYTTKQIFDFGEADSDVFEKINPGTFGVTGDLYLHSEGNNPPVSSPITADVRKEYSTLVSQYIMPALQKK